MRLDSVTVRPVGAAMVARDASLKINAELTKVPSKSSNRRDDVPAISTLTVPNPLALVIAMVPALIPVLPLKGLAPVSVSVPAPSLMSVPEPLIAPSNVRLPARLITSTPLFTTLPLPSVPVVPPLPTCKVPALIVVPPE